MPGFLGLDARADPGSGIKRARLRHAFFFYDLGRTTKKDEAGIKGKVTGSWSNERDRNGRRV